MSEYDERVAEWERLGVLGLEVGEVVGSSLDAGVGERELEPRAAVMVEDYPEESAWFSDVPYDVSLLTGLYLAVDVDRLPTLGCDVCEVYFYY